MIGQGGLGLSAITRHDILSAFLDDDAPSPHQAWDWIV